MTEDSESEDKEDPPQWEHRKLFLEICQGCEAIMPCLSARLANWGFPHNDTSDESSSGDGPLVSVAYCTRCQNDDARMARCAQCEETRLDDVDGDPNLRPQDKNFFWCPACSVGKSGNFCGA